MYNNYEDWLKKYYLLIEYLKINNNYPKTNETYKGVNLGNWVLSQRQVHNLGAKISNGVLKYKTTTLSEKQINMLNEINFTWEVKKRYSWDVYYNLLIEYLEKYNTYPKKGEVYKKVNLGNWINIQRNIYRNGEHQTDGSIKYNSIKLTKEQINMLNEINFIWIVKKQYSWDYYYNLLIEYLKNYNTYPKANEIYKGVNLGDWISTQKSIYNNGILREDGCLEKYTKILTQERIKKLNIINFNWDIKIKSWDYYYNLLIEYLHDNNNYPKRKEVYKEVNLGDWINKQRTIYNNGTLDNEGNIIYQSNILSKNRIEKLNSINFNWKVATTSWDDYLNLLIEYLNNNSGLYPKANEEYKNVKLGNWVHTQRKVFNNGVVKDNNSIISNNHILTKDQIKKLESINFNWVLNEKKYNSRIISNKEELISLRRLLLSKINRLPNIEFNNKSDINILNDNFLNSFYTKKLINKN